MAAVSARKIVEPREAEVHPAFWKSCNSSSAQPPSGPIASKISPAAESTTSRSKVCFSASASTIRREPGSADAAGEFHCGSDLGRSGAARLLGRLEGDSAPPVDSFRRGRGQVRVGAAGDYGHDSRDSQFGAFLDRPFHAVELENGEQESDAGYGDHRNFFPEFELNSGVLDACDASAPHNGTGGDIEFLSYAGTQDADQMIGMIAGEGGVVAREFVGDPAASRHGEVGPQRLNMSAEPAFGWRSARLWVAQRFQRCDKTAL